MSSRQWRTIRGALKREQAETDRMKRRALLLPLWVRVAAWFYPPIRADWLASWEHRHRAALRKAMKKTAHIYKGENHEAHAGTVGVSKELRHYFSINWRLDRRGDSV